MDLAAINEGFLRQSLEGLGEDVTLISPEGVRHTFKGQVNRVYVTAGEDSRGIAQGSRQSNKISTARVTLRITSLLEALGTIALKSYVCQIRQYPHAESALQLMHVEDAPDGDTSMGIHILSLNSIKRLTP